MGAPMMAVIAPRGNSTGDTILRAVKSQAPAINAPPTAVAGINILLFEVPNKILQICGTASPIKDTGPAKAVTAAVRMLDIKIRA